MKHFATFGFASSARNNYMIVEGADTTDALRNLAKHVGYTKSGAVRCAFVYPINELEEQIAKYGLTEIPLGAPVYYERED